MVANIVNRPAKDRTEARAEATRGGVFFTPRVDIVETDTELTIFAEVPGVLPEDVELRYEKGELLLHARVKPGPERSSMLLQEYEEGDFFRAFTIHELIDADRITAECKNGLLAVHLPKAEAIRPRRIAVRGN
ncbi:MAG TPA: Hsp20/alpha crystallin family protein [Gemmataceae bacterium]|nr:Hsp20/alpha crystallin family protein [Gemmataceae bacterium]